MRITYDARANAAYIQFGTEAHGLKTLPINEVVLLDFDADGVLYGIELLDARHQLGINDTSTLSVEAGGRSVTLPLVAAE